MDQGKGPFHRGEPINTASTTTTVRVRDGRISTTDGPFVETKEQVGGCYVIGANGLNEAIQVAARIPGAQRGCVEVRPAADGRQTLALLGAWKFP